MCKRNVYGEYVLNWDKFFAMVFCLVGIIFLVKGFCEIDWMMNSFRMWDAVPMDYQWWINNKVSVDWWDHYMNSFLGALIGSM